MLLTSYHHILTCSPVSHSCNSIGGQKQSVFEEHNGRILTLDVSIGLPNSWKPPDDLLSPNPCPASTEGAFSSRGVREPRNGYPVARVGVVGVRYYQLFRGSGE